MKYYLAYHMGLSACGPVRYLLIPEDTGRFSGVAQFESIMENGKPAGKLYAHRLQICSLRLPDIDGISPAEVLLINTIKACSQAELPEIIPTPENQGWNGYWEKTKRRA